MLARVANLFRSLASAAMDASVVLSLGRPGFSLRRGGFDDPDIEVDLTGRLAVVTGASSGLGLETTLALSRRGAEVIAVCRDAGRAEAALGSKTNVRVELADLSLVRACHSLADRLAREGAIDILVNNAGALPSRRVSTDEGNDAAFATNVLAQFILTERLAENLAAGRSRRVVNVTSAGMFLVKLDFDELQGLREPYDGVRVYAQTKRAQMILTQIAAERLGSKDVRANACHPGWAATKGVAESLPRFETLMRPLLRTAEEGADTILFLAASEAAPPISGGLFFDRRLIKSDIFPWLRPSELDRDTLYRLCADRAGILV